jgi:ABC-type lipoprotein release transport system permease subunit
MADEAMVKVGDTVKVIVPVKIGEQMKDAEVGAVVLSLGPPCVTVQLPPGPYGTD